MTTATQMTFRIYQRKPDGSYHFLGTFDGIDEDEAIAEAREWHNDDVRPMFAECVDPEAQLVNQPYYVSSRGVTTFVP